MIWFNLRLLSLLNLTLRERKAIFMASIGCMLEFYDFIIFGFMSIYFISGVLHDNLISRKNVFMFFAIFILGYILRPIGMKLYSKIAPVQNVKIIDLIITILLIIATISISLISAQNSFSAIIVLLLARSIQGIASGAEMQANLDHLAIKLSNNVNYAILGILAGNELGQVLGVMINRGLNLFYTHQQMNSFGWRIPFIFSAILSIVIYLIRLQFSEHLTEQHCYRKIIPAYYLLRYYRSQTIIAIILSGLRGAMTFIFLIFVPFVLCYFLNYTFAKISQIIFIASLIGSGCAYLVNRICSNCKQDYKIFGYFMYIFALLSIPAIIFLGYAIDNQIYVILSIIPIAILNSCFTVISPSVILGLFPTNVRLSGVSFTNHSGFIICAGLVPLINSGFSTLLHYVFPKYSLSFIFYFSLISYIVILSLLTLFCLQLMRKYVNYQELNSIRCQILAKLDPDRCDNINF